MRVSLVSKTSGVGELAGRSADEITAYCARVSNPSNQHNFKNSEKLLKYCLEHGHVSIFEMVDFTFEIVTSRAVAAQVLRHRHHNFQEFSQRYSAVQKFEIYEARLQDSKNKQNSLPTNDKDLDDWFLQAQHEIINRSSELYEEALQRGVAKEQARFLLPMSSQTTMYMKGSLRSWIHYLAIRMGVETQKEHRDIAVAIFEILKDEVPSIASLLEGYSIIENNPYG